MNVSDNSPAMPRIGHAEIDRQHDGLMKSLDKLHGHVGTDRQYSAVFTAIEFLRDYVLKHFSYEEDVLRESGYPKLEEHVSAHRAIAKKVTELTDRILQGEEITEDVLLTMRTWVAAHIGGDDMEYADFLKTAPSSEKPVIP